MDMQIGRIRRTLRTQRLDRAAQLSAGDNESVIAVEATPPIQRRKTLAVSRSSLLGSTASVPDSSQAKHTQS